MLYEGSGVMEGGQRKYQIKFPWDGIIEETDCPEGAEPSYLCGSSIILAFKIHLGCIRTLVIFYKC